MNFSAFTTPLSTPPPVTWISQPPKPEQTTIGILKQDVPDRAFFPRIRPDLSTSESRDKYKLNNLSWEYPYTSRPLLDLNALPENLHSSFLNVRISQALCKIERLVIFRMVGKTNSKQGKRRPFVVEMLSEEEWKHLVATLSASATPLKRKSRIVRNTGGDYTSTTISWSEATGLPELNSGPQWYIKKYVHEYDDETKTLYCGTLITFQLIYNDLNGCVNCKFSWSCKSFNNSYQKWC